MQGGPLKEAFEFREKAKKKKLELERKKVFDRDQAKRNNQPYYDPTKNRTWTIKSKARFIPSPGHLGVLIEPEELKKKYGSEASVSIKVKGNHTSRIVIKEGPGQGDILVVANNELN